MSQYLSQYDFFFLYAGFGLAVIGFIAVLFVDMRVGGTDRDMMSIARATVQDITTISSEQGKITDGVRDQFEYFEGVTDSQTKRLNDQMSMIVALQKQHEVTANRLEMTETAGILTGENLRTLYEGLIANGTFRVVERARKVKRIRATAPRRRRA